MAPHKSKKRKISAEQNRPSLDTSRPSAVFRPTKGRTFTLSVALPGSIIANALTHEQKTALVGQVARALAVFCVDEVIVYDDGQCQIREPEEGGYTAFADPNFFLYHLLTYLETPPYLRKALFPMHPDLRTAGALPSLDMPHHLRADEWCSYREAVSVRRGRDKHGRSGAFVDCGLADHIFVPVELEDAVRVTVKFSNDSLTSGQHDMLADAVSPETPREERGYFWGYNVRQASSLSAVFTECQYEGGYDVSIGTSERGEPVHRLSSPASDTNIEPSWNHLLIIFGGVAGIEAAVSADAELHQSGLSDAKDLFDRWVNILPGQGSRTIRTEEALWIGLTQTRALIEARVAV